MLLRFQSYLTPNGILKRCKSQHNSLNLKSFSKLAQLSSAFTRLCLARSCLQNATSPKDVTSHCIPRTYDVVNRFRGRSHDPTLDHSPWSLPLVRPRRFTYTGMHVPQSLFVIKVIPKSTLCLGKVDQNCLWLFTKKGELCCCLRVARCTLVHTPPFDYS